MHDRINWKSRLIGLVGPRGVGKTTLLLQHIVRSGESDSALYVSADWFYFSSHRLTDLASEVSKLGLTKLYVDEIHRYPSWSQELKQIYDLYPELHVVFTGSSVLDIFRGSADLSRRATMYTMQGLSFREYLAMVHDIIVPVVSMEEVLHHAVPAAMPLHPLPLFRQYLREGYYPFALNGDYYQHLMQVLQQTLEGDIPAYADMSVSVARKLLQLMGIIADSVPFKPNMTKLAQLIDTSRNYIADYLLYMERAGMIMQLRDGVHGVRGLGKVEKIYLDNTNLAYALQRQPDIGNMRETFFMNQARVAGEVTAAGAGDFLVSGKVFEVGGHGKQQRQIAGVKDAFVVKDDIEIGTHNIIPLWMFGLLY